MEETTISFHSIESIHRSEIQFILAQEKGINDTKFNGETNKKVMCFYPYGNLIDIIAGGGREGRNDNIVPSIVFDQVNNPLSTIEH